MKLFMYDICSAMTPFISVHKRANPETEDATLEETNMTPPQMDQAAGLQEVTEASPILQKLPVIPEEGMTPAKTPHKPAVDSPATTVRRFLDAVRLEDGKLFLNDEFIVI